VNFYQVGTEELSLGEVKNEVLDNNRSFNKQIDFFNGNPDDMCFKSRQFSVDDKKYETEDIIEIISDKKKNERARGKEVSKELSQSEEPFNLDSFLKGFQQVIEVNEISSVTDDDVKDS